MTDQETYKQSDDAIPDPPPIPPSRPPDEEYYRRRPAPTRSRRVTLGAALLLVGVLWLSVELFSRGTIFGGALSSATLVDRTLPGTRLQMEVGAADVDVRSWGGQGIRVEAIQHGGSQGDYT